MKTKTGFPHKNFFGRPKGWEDLGKVQVGRTVEDGRTITITPTHAFCNVRVHIGKENNQLFKFCPRCMVKVEDK